MDLVLVLDESGSARGSMYYKGTKTQKYLAQRLFVNELTEQLELGSTATQVAVVGFGSRGYEASGTTYGARTLSGFSTSRSAISAAVQKTRASGYTYVEYGMKLAEDLIAGTGRASAKKLVVVLLDGRPSSSVTSSEFVSYVRALQALGTVVAVGYTAGADKAALGAIASAPAADFVFANYDLDVTAGQLADSKMCELMSKTKAPTPAPSSE